MAQVCGKCGLDETETDFYVGHTRNRCKPCRRTEVKMRAANFTDLEVVAIRRRERDWHHKHSAKMRAYRASWAEKNPEVLEAARRERVASGRAAAYQRAWRATLTFEERAPQRNSVRRYRALKRQNFVENVNEAIVWLRDEGRCGICGGSADKANWHLDHVVPVSKGGEHSYANVQVSHPECNMRKGNKLIQS